MAADHQTILLVSLLFLLQNVSLSRGWFGFENTYTRQVSMEWNPGLTPSVSPPPPGVTLIHIRSLGSDDTLHFLLWNQGSPTLLIVHTNSTSSSVQVDWPAFLAGNPSSLRVEPEHSVLHSNAVVLVRLWEYDDFNDTAEPQQAADSSFFSPYQLSNFTWNLDNRSLDQRTPAVQLCGGDGTPAFSAGTLCIQLTAFGSGGREAGWPGLLHSANSSQVRVWLQGVLPRAPASRFLLELHAAGRPSTFSQVEVQQSIDDEYTPSIFTISQWLAAPTNRSSPILGFIQWKPVAYRQPAPIFTDVTPCHHSQPVAVEEASASGLLLAFYGQDADAHGLNLSYGGAGEPFYNASHYLSWSMLAGMGDPPVDSFSPLVLGIMAVGLGTPLLLLLLGGVFVCARKRRLADWQAYSSIN